MAEIVTIIKLGGSIITKKDTPFSLNESNLTSLIRNISEYMAKKDSEEKIIILHGGGSFSHMAAFPYQNVEANTTTLEMGPVLINTATRSLNLKIIKVMLDYGIRVFPFQASSLFIKNDGNLVISTPVIIQNAIEMNWIPVLYGDVILDTDSRQWQVTSSESIIKSLSDHLAVKRILMATDKDGVLKDMMDSSSIVRVINHNNITQMEKFLRASQNIDTTGGMRDKVNFLYQLALNRKIISLIFNGNKKGLLFRALNGGYDFGTKIEF